MKAHTLRIDKDPTGRSWTEIARCLNIKPHTIWTWRCVHPEIIEFIYTFDESSFENAYRKYQEAVQDIRQEIQEIIEHLEDNRKISAFSQYLYEKNIYKHRLSFATTAIYTFYGIKDNMTRVSDFKRFCKIVEAYEQFKVKAGTMSYKEAI